ncbi:MAG: HD domain-containing protein [Planctomycetia bacterium]|nr:HD domain-containing protein [Planctomycetia bacterium]
MQIFKILRSGGASDVLIVGGHVRDTIMDLESKDIDLEVYGLTFQNIIEILSPFFRINAVGQSFGVLKVNNEIDIALPRRESKAGVGHTQFDIQSDPYLDPYTAFSRRDFTINAIGMREDGSFYDPYHGIDDIKNKRLRAVGPAFKDDPLRVLRGMQFAARFGFTMDQQTIDFCQQVRPEFEQLSKERIYEEWKKWILKGLYPSKGLLVLEQTKWIDCFPELSALAGCPQNPKWHPEGDVWKHTQLVCDAMKHQILAHNSADAPFASDPFTEEEQLILMFAALTHDFGKPSTTAPDENGVLRSLDHAKEGTEIAQAFLENMRAPIFLAENVCPLVREHMGAMALSGDEAPSPRTVRRLACRLDPANIRLWAYLCQADALGTGSSGAPIHGEITEESLANAKVHFKADRWLEIARQLNLEKEKPTPLVQGRNLISLGIGTGPSMGKILKQAFEAQLDGEFSTPEEGIEWIKNNIDLKIQK